jgi:hypothetical protein
LPRFEPPSAELLASIEAALAQPAHADPVNAPRLLWGAPGGGAERLVALLGGRTDGRVMIDRFGAQPRVDGFRLTQLGRRRASSPEQQAERFALEWRKGVSSFNAQPQDIDWLPHWDARLLPNLIRGLPDARVLVALRDPRDMLLNWMAFGTAQRHALVDPVEAARWLTSALEQFLPLREGTRPSLHVVRMRELDNDAAQVAARRPPHRPHRRRTERRPAGSGRAAPSARSRRRAPPASAPGRRSTPGDRWSPPLPRRARRRRRGRPR